MQLRQGCIQKQPHVSLTKISVSNAFFRFALAIAVTGAAAQLPARAQEQAKSADSFVDSIGIDQFQPDYDASFFDTANAYGFRHVRAAILSFQAVNHAAIASQAYSKYGIKLDAVVNQASSVSDNLSWLKNVNLSAVEAIEGPNEVDGGYGIGNTAAPIYQSNLYNAVKGDSSLTAIFRLVSHRYSTTQWLSLTDCVAYSSGNRCNSISVLNFTVINDYQTASDANDYANVHLYGFEDSNNPFLPPAQSPYGTNAYGSIGFDISKAESGIANGAQKPVVFTEAGYFTSAGHSNQISRLDQAKYEPMLLATNFNRGVKRTYIYSLFDSSEGTDINNQPAGTAIKNLIATLSDSSWNPNTQTRNISNFTPGQLDYIIQTSSGNIQHTLLQKQNGDFYLLLWNEVPVYDVRNGTGDINNTPVSVTLNFSTPLTNTATVYTQNSDGTYSSSNADLSSGSLNVNVPDSVMLVRLSPAAAATMPLDRSSWTATASSNAGSGQMPAQAIDGNPSTR